MQRADVLIDEYVELRDKLSDERRIFKATEESIKLKMTQLEVKILELQQSLGVNSLSAHGLTAFQTTKTYVRVGDWQTFIKYVVKHDHTQLLEKRVAKLAALELFKIEDVNPEQIGLTREEELAIQIRRK